MKTFEIIEENRKSVISLIIWIPAAKDSGKGGVSIIGTGFIVSPDGKFIISAHTYKKIPQNELQYLKVLIHDRKDEKGIIHHKQYKTELIKMDEDNDIALMKIISDRTDFQSIKKLGDSELVKEGDEAIFLGYSLGTELLERGFGITMNTTSCIISSVKKRNDGYVYFFIVDAYMNNGSSGSPVFSKETGEVIGVMSDKILILSRIAMPDGKVFDIPAKMGICRPSRYINKIIK